MTTFKKGPNNVTQLSRQNLSYKQPWVQVYTDTVLDSWHVGKYSSATYHITVEFDSNQKETMQVLVVARPEHASYTMFGRTSIQDELITLSASVTTNTMTLIVNPASPEFTGARVIFNALYSETLSPLTLPTVVPSSSTGTAGMPTPSEIYGTFSTIEVNNQPSIVASYDLDTLTLSQGPGIGITLNSVTKTITLSSTANMFRSFEVIGSNTLTPSSPNDTLTLTGSNGILINTDNNSNTVDVSLSAATINTLGGVRVDGTTITINNGVISSAGQVLPTASQTEKGGVKVDGSSITINNSVISATLYAGTTLLNSTSGNLALTGITGFSTTASSTATPSLNIAINTGANSVTGLSYSTLASGSITIASGSTTSGLSGAVNINSGNAGWSGAIGVKPGTSTVFAGDVNISGGDLDNATNSYGGNVKVSGGKGLGGSSGSYGGNLFLYGGGPEGSPVTSKGGDIYMFGGAAAQYATGVKTNGNILIGDQTTNIISIASTTVMPNIGSASAAKTINIGSSTSTTTIAGTAKFPTVGTSGLVSLGTGGTLSAVTPSIGYLTWTGSAYEWTPNIISTGIGATGVSTTVAGPLVVAESLSTAATGISTASWATSGVNLKLQSRTYTDTSSTGTIASSYVNVMASPTLASTNAVTITNAASLFVDAPIASTNTTITNGWAIYASGKIRATDLVLANALPVGQGGTGSTTAADALTALGAYAATNPSGFTSNTGTVTSVGISVPSFLSAGSAITTSGTIAISLSGTALPIANGGTGSTATTFVNLTTNVTGTLPIANGGTGSTATTFVNLTTNVTGTLPIANGGTGSTATTFVNLTTNVTGTLPIANGGTGATTLTGMLKGNGTSAFTAASAGTDFLAPGGVLGTPSSGTLTNCTADGTNKVGYRNIPEAGGADKTAAYTLAIGDVGMYVGVGTSGSIVVPTAVFANGDAISIYNNTTGNITITTSAPTAYIAGTNTAKTSITLATRGIATILFVSASVCVVSGNVS